MSRQEMLAVTGSVLKAGGVTLWASTAVTLGILALAYQEQLLLLKKGQSQWLPFASALIGVSLYFMSTAKTYRDNWQLRYLPDYCYRAAQAVVYVYIVLAIMGQEGWGLADGPPQVPPIPDFSHWPPNLIGLVVGLFILHVEKAVEGFGQRFEEALTAVLGRSLTARTSREKQIARLRDEQTFSEIERQAELLASQLRSPGAREAIQRRLATVGALVRTGSPEELRQEVEKLSWEFEQIKVALREDSQTVAEILGGARRLRRG